MDYVFQLNQNSLVYWIVFGEGLVPMGQYHKEGIKL
jgi:hypothetical protein